MDRQAEILDLLVEFRTARSPSSRASAGARLWALLTAMGTGERNRIAWSLGLTGARKLFEYATAHSDRGPEAFLRRADKLLADLDPSKLQALAQEVLPDTAREGLGLRVAEKPIAAPPLSPDSIESQSEVSGALIETDAVTEPDVAESGVTERAITPEETVREEAEEPGMPETWSFDQKPPAYPPTFSAAPDERSAGSVSVGLGLQVSSLETESTPGAREAHEPHFEALEAIASERERYERLKILEARTRLAGADLLQIAALFNTAWRKRRIALRAIRQLDDIEQAEKIIPLLRSCGLAERDLAWCAGELIESLPLEGACRDLLLGAVASSHLRTRLERHLRRA